MDWLTSKYVGLLASRVRNFKRKSNNLAQFSCPYCGDSKKNRFKARGYVYDKKGESIFHCHNCAVSKKFRTLLRDVDHDLYNDYIKEIIFDKKPVEQLGPAAKTFKKIKVLMPHLKRIKSIMALPPDHFAVEYVKERKIPVEVWKRLYYCPKFYKWTNDVLGITKFDLTKLQDHPRLVIPFLTKEGELHAYQGRSFDPDDKLRYISIVVNEDIPKIWGLDTVDFSKRVYCTEGPLDALFLNNSISVAGGDIAVALNSLAVDKSLITVIYDNERRSPQLVKKITKAVNAGYSVFLWPEHEMGKDINDAIRNGYSIEELKEIIDENTYSGLSATLQLQKWKRVSNVYGSKGI